mmetsp:Transcript_15516/g.32801  ORF Transcript_15516/g.32801 Transcript_15516/m.32801 type:complete len:203 (+) Transcript_15516:1466-2074(+)
MRLIDRCIVVFAEILTIPAVTTMDHAVHARPHEFCIEITTVVSGALGSEFVGGAEPPPLRCAEFVSFTKGHEFAFFLAMVIVGKWTPFLCGRALGPVGIGSACVFLWRVARTAFDSIGFIDGCFKISQGQIIFIVPIIGIAATAIANMDQAESSGPNVLKIQLTAIADGTPLLQFLGGAEPPSFRGAKLLGIGKGAKGAVSF